MAVANYLYLSAILFTIGAIGVVVRRNSIVVFMCIELMLNAANLAFVTFARINGNLEGQVVAVANYLYLSAILFTIGAIGVVVRRNSIVVFMCIELMLNAANLAFVTFARINGNLEGQVVAFFTMVVAACEVVVGLAIIVTIYRSRRSASIDDASLLKR